MDERQFRMTPIMTLTTREGDIDVLDGVQGVGDFAKVLSHSVELAAFDVRFAALDLPALMRPSGRLAVQRTSRNFPNSKHCWPCGDNQSLPR
jgi:hypothetical protein